MATGRPRLVPTTRPVSASMSCPDRSAPSTVKRPEANPDRRPAPLLDAFDRLGDQPDEPLGNAPCLGWLVAVGLIMLEGTDLTLVRDLPITASEVPLLYIVSDAEAAGPSRLELSTFHLDVLPSLVKQRVVEVDPSGPERMFISGVRDWATQGRGEVERPTDVDQVAVRNGRDAGDLRPGTVAVTGRFGGWDRFDYSGS
jgi:hypothetical protein